MRVLPLAAESLGVRSMATYVEAGGTSILIDPGATLAPARYGLPPAEAEWEALRRANDRISAYATRAETVFISHYHEDHFRSDPVSYVGKIVLAKDPRRMVNGSQARRGAELWTAIADHARLTPADGYRLRTPSLELRVSSPLPHGVEGTALGYVVALTVIEPAERARFVFASDVQGPLSAVASAYLIQERPTLLYLSGPPSYLERDLGTPAVERGIEQLLRVIETTECRVIMDHHALRDVRWGARFARLWETGRVVTAAGHLGINETALESRRNRLWAAVRKPPARVETTRAILTRTPRKSAKGGFAE
jgi:uncharacterized protein